jgi:hypothetical protein
MPVLGSVADVVDHRFGSREVNPDNAGMVIVGKHQVRLAIAVDVAHPATLRVVAVGDEMLLPHHIRLLRVLIPPESVQHPTRRNHVECSIVVDIDRPLAGVRDKLIHYAHRPILMLLPHATLGPRILIPIGPTKQIRPAIAVHVHRGNSFRVVRPQAMHEKGRLRHTSGPVTRCCLSRRLWFLRISNGGEKSESDCPDEHLDPRSP